MEVNRPMMGTLRALPILQGSNSLDLTGYARRKTYPLVNQMLLKKEGNQKINMG